jgi:cobalt-zinc-cadmium efflux system membrane fusion protein
MRTLPPETSRPGWKAALALGAVLLAVAGCGRQGAGAASTEENAAAREDLETVPVQLQRWPREVRVQGSLRADEHAVLGAKVAGRVAKVHVDLGSKVSKDDVLATLDMEDLHWRKQQAEAQLEQARAKLGLGRGEKIESVDAEKVPAVVQEKALVDEARANLGREKPLLLTKAISVEQLQERETALAVAEARYRSALNEVAQQTALVGVRAAELELARQAIKDAEIRAPFAGVISERHVAPGVYLQIGQRVVSLVRIDRLRFRGGVPEREAAQLDLGQTATVKVDGHARPIAALKVARISPALDTACRSLCAEIDVGNQDGRFRAGLFAEATITVDPEARTLVVPATALSEFAGVQKVWKVKDGKPLPCTVRAGRRDAKRIEVLDGLAEGDVVAAHGLDRRARVARGE